jgi:hypothetical protein
LLQQRKWANRLIKMTRANKNFARCESPFMGNMTAWYGAYAIMAVRRQSDDDERVESLRRILEQMKANPPALVGVSPMGTVVSAADIDADIQRLVRVSALTVRIATKEIAHAQRGGAGNDRLSFRELDACVDAYAEVAKKYVLILTGAAMLTLEPIEQFDANDVFQFSWIPRCTNCRHSANYHSDNGRGCNGAAEDYHRMIRAGETPSATFCACAISESEVYAQTREFSI